MPTVTIGDNTGGSANTYSGTEDTMLVNNAPTTNVGGNTTYEIKKYAAGDHGHVLIRFPGLSNITGPVTVSAATLYVYYNGSGASAYNISARATLRNWAEAQATWNVYTTGNSWTTAGALSAGNDRNSTVLATGAYDSGHGPEYVAFAGLESWVQDTINNALSASAGLHLERADAGEDTAFANFVSSEGTNAQRPYLEITYEAAAGDTLMAQGMS